MGSYITFPPKDLTNIKMPFGWKPSGYKKLQEDTDNCSEWCHCGCPQGVEQKEAEQRQKDREEEQRMRAEFIRQLEHEKEEQKRAQGEKDQEEAEKTRALRLKYNSQ